MSPMNQIVLKVRPTFMKILSGLFLSMLVSTAAFATASATSVSPPASAEVHYDITVRLDPIARKLEGRSVITANTSEELTLVIGRRFEVMHGRVDAEPFGPAATMGRMRGWRILGNEKLPRRIEIHWRGELAALDTALDHHQTLGRNDPASGEAGTFLPDSSGWYPYLADKLASYNLTIELPPRATRNCARSSCRGNRNGGGVSRTVRISGSDRRYRSHGGSLCY